MEKKKNLVAPCGLYCGACMIYHANKRGDTEFLTQIKERFSKLVSCLKEGKRIPGMPPPTKDFDPARMQREIEIGVIDLNCEGCLSDVLGFPCRNCGFCECVQEKGLTNCSQCPEVPCQWLIDFNNDGIPHHGEVLGNIQRQKEIGIHAWLAEQEERWRCARCSSTLTWYDTECPDCGATQSQTFGPYPLFD